MSSIRIKNLQSAIPLIEQEFNKMQFVVDLDELDSTLKLSGAELKEAVSVQKHTHHIEDVGRLTGELENKYPHY